MADEYIQQVEESFDFLKEADVQEHFADLNIELLKGAHIQQDDHYLFQLLIEYEKHIRYYYQVLYSLQLVRDKFDNAVFFYLDFIGDGKGEVSHTSRHREVTESEVVIGIMLLNMYYDRYFDSPKEIFWTDIKKEILESENSDAYKKLLFNDVREDYSDPEWEITKKIIRRTLRDFNILRWVSRLSAEDGEDIHFVIKESIQRFAKLYKEEIDNFDTFVEEYLKRNETK
jgi:hypothetical protein